MMLHTNYQGSRPCGFRQKICFTFSLNRLSKTNDPQGGTVFWPQGYNSFKLGRGPLGDATYQISSLQALWFQTNGFFHILLI